jgi:hypothetical protein
MQSTIDTTIAEESSKILSFASEALPSENIEGVYISSLAWDPVSETIIASMRVGTGRSSYKTLLASLDTSLALSAAPGRITSLVEDKYTNQSFHVDIALDTIAVKTRNKHGTFLGLFDLYGKFERNITLGPSTGDESLLIGNTGFWLAGPYDCTRLITDDAKVLRYQDRGAIHLTYDVGRNVEIHEGGKPSGAGPLFETSRGEVLLQRMRSFRDAKGNIHNPLGDLTTCDANYQRIPIDYPVYSPNFDPIFGSRILGKGDFGPVLFIDNERFVAVEYLLAGKKMPTFNFPKSFQPLGLGFTPQG